MKKSITTIFTVRKTLDLLQRCLMDAGTEEQDRERIADIMMQLEDILKN